MSTRSRLPLLIFLTLSMALPAQDDGHLSQRRVGEALLVAEGLEVKAWARSPLFYNPTGLDFDERGRVWVTEAVNYRDFQNKGRKPRRHENGDRVVILEDSDGDGTADRSKVFVADKDLVAPLGLAVFSDRVIVSSSPNLIVYSRDAEDRVTKKEILLTGWGGFDHDHSLHALEGGPDGRWYLNAGNAGPHIVTDRSGWTLRAGSWYTGGSPHNTRNTPGLRSDDGRIYAGGVALSLSPDGTGMKVIGHGFRNPYGTCVDSFGNVWMNDNDDTQSCRTTWLMRYGDCGYSSKDGKRSWRADQRPGQSVRAAHWRQDDPGVIPSGHVYGNGAPCGIVYYENGNLGPSYEGGLLLSCEAGQNIVWGYRRVPDGAGYKLEGFPFLTTTRQHDPNYRWSKEEADRAKWFRPSDVAVGTDGAVYVADWFDQVVGGHRMNDRIGAGTIYRVTRKGENPRSPRYDMRSTKGLVAAIGSPANHVRFSAAAKLREATPKDPELRARLTAIAKNDDDRFLRARATWLLDEGHGELLEDSDAEIRIVAFRTLRDASPGARLTAASRLARDPSPAVRREAALAMRDFSFQDSRDILVDIAKRYKAGDRWYLEAFGTGCEGKEGDIYATLLAVLGSPQLTWSPEFADIVWRLHPPTATPALRDRALSNALSRTARKRAIDTLAFTRHERAAEAMVAVAAKGPVDLRSYAAWWVRHRSANDWRSIEVARSFAGKPKQRDELPKLPRFRSDLVRAGSIDIRVEIADARTLWLVADDGGDGKSCDWADWIEPRLVGPGGEKLLTELDWTSATTDYGTIEKNRNCKGGPLRVGGIRYDNGIGTHANSILRFDIGGAGFTQLVARAGVDNGGPDLGGSDHASRRSSVRFSVYVDGPGPAQLAAKHRRALTAATSNEDTRLRAAEALLRTAEGGHALLELQKSGRIPESVREVVIEGIYRNPDLAVRSLAGRVFPRPSALPPIDEILRRSGDVARGRELFFGETAKCGSCHAFDGKGQDVGPDLTRVQEKFARRELVDAILNPSAAILSGYEMKTILLKTGETLSGVILAEGETVLLKDAAGKRHEIPRARIAARQNQDISLMPELDAELDAQALVDIVSFLRSSVKKD